MSIKKSYYFSLIITLLSFTTAFSQGQGNSPYSVIGIGELASQTVAAQDMMGGAGTSFANGFYVNVLNPALVAKNRVVGSYKYVAFNVGLRGNSRNIVQGNNSVQDFGYNLQNLQLSFPLRKDWAMALSLRPYSMVDYKTTTTQQLETPDGTRTFNYVNQSTGGISRVSYINSINLFNGLYVGLETSYNFGTIFRDSTRFLNGSLNQFRSSSRYNLSGANIKLGAAYQLKLSENWRLNSGVSMETSGRLKTKELNTFAIYQDSQNGSVLSSNPDTLSMSNYDSSTPSQLRLGLSLESPYHWIFAVDYGITNWDAHKPIDDISSRTLGNSRELSLGVEYLPNSSSTKYFNQVFYRLGYYNSDTPYNINGTRVQDNRFSFGMSMPMGFRNPSYIDLGIAFGRRGVNAPGLVEENYIRINTSISLLSPWFLKPKID